MKQKQKSTVSHIWESNKNKRMICTFMMNRFLFPERRRRDETFTRTHFSAVENRFVESMRYTRTFNGCSWTSTECNTLSIVNYAHKQRLTQSVNSKAWSTRQKEMKTVLHIRRDNCRKILFNNSPTTIVNRLLFIISSTVFRQIGPDIWIHVTTEFYSWSKPSAASSIQWTFCTLIIKHFDCGK